MSVAILFASAVSIFSMIYKLYQARKNRQLQSKEFKQRLGALTQDQQIRSFPGIFWRPLVLLRWTATMLIMTLLRNNFYLQIFLLLVISTIFQFMIVGSKPMLAKVNNNMLLFNEIMVSIYLYHLLCLTDFMGDHDQRDLIAWSLLFIVVITVLVNLVKFLVSCDWCFLIRKVKKKCFKKKMYEDNNKRLDVSNDLNDITGQSERGEQNQLNIKKKKKKKKSTNLINNHNDEFFKKQPHNEYQTKETMNEPEPSFTVPSEFGGGFCYHLDEGEEFKQDQRHEISSPYSKNSSDLDLVIESYNFEQDANKNPFSQFHQQRMKMEQVPEMRWEIRKLPELITTENMIPIKPKKNEFYNL